MLIQQVLFTGLASSLHAAPRKAKEDYVITMFDQRARNKGMNPTSVEEPVEPFETSWPCGVFNVTEDIYERQVPPAEIRDLRAYSIRQEANGMLLGQLWWTWPGAHLYSGNGELKWRFNRASVSWMGNQ